MARIVNPSAVHLKLRSSLKVHPTFHMSLLKLVSLCVVVTSSFSLGGMDVSPVANERDWVSERFVLVIGNQA